MCALPAPLQARGTAGWVFDKTVAAGAQSKARPGPKPREPRHQFMPGPQWGLAVAGPMAQQQQQQSLATAMATPRPRPSANGQSSMHQNQGGAWQMPSTWPQPHWPIRLPQIEVRISGLALAGPHPRMPRSSEQLRRSQDHAVRGSLWRPR
jgi:hypothetical protein